MRFFLNHGKNYLTAYDFYCNIKGTKNPLGKETNFSEIANECKLFVIRNELINLFLTELQKGSSQKIIPFDETNPNKEQPILRLPFEKIWIEPFEEIPNAIFPKLGICWLGVMIEDGKTIEEPNSNDYFYFTFIVYRNKNLALIPIKIKKYVRIKIEGEDTPHAETYPELVAMSLRILGFGVTKEDINEVIGTTHTVVQGKVTTSNRLLCLDYFMGNIFSLTTWIIQYINTANSEISYIGNSEKDYQRRISKGTVPVPPAHTIILKDKIIKPGFLFDGKKFSLKYIFDVRGHYRTFKNSRYKNMLGKTIWINPFKRGKGKFVKKNNRTTRADLWNQKSMKRSATVKGVELKW